MAEYITWRGKTTTTKNKAITSGNRLGSVEALEASAAGTKSVTSHHRSPGGERRRKEKEKGYRQSIEHSGGAHMGISEREDTILD